MRGSQRETGLRVALVTPDDLNHQWIEELCCRTHVGSDGVPVEPEADAAAPKPRKGRVAVELFRPARLAAGAVRLNAKFYDMLVVDEYTKLSKEMRDLVGVASRAIPHVLLLSATPAMHDPAKRRRPSCRLPYVAPTRPTWPIGAGSPTWRRLNS